MVLVCFFAKAKMTATTAHYQFDGNAVCRFVNRRGDLHPATVRSGLSGCWYIPSMPGGMAQHLVLNCMVAFAYEVTARYNLCLDPLNSLPRVSTSITAC